MPYVTQSSAAGASFDAQPQRTCDVCRLVDGDTRPKPVQWCDFCKAWICDACRNNPFRRGLAAMRMRFAGR